MNKKYSTAIFTPSSADNRKRLNIAIIKNKNITPAYTPIDIEKENAVFISMSMLNFTITLKIQGIAGHNEILQMPI